MTLPVETIVIGNRIYQCSDLYGLMDARGIPYTETDEEAP
jgi:hypothetical protein